MSLIVIVCTGFLVDVWRKRAAERGEAQIRAMGSLFSGRTPSCLTTRYAAPYVSAHMRPLVHIGTKYCNL